MATISLYASRINQMPELLKTTMNNSVAFQNSLKDLNKKILKIDNSACDVYNEAGIVQASVNTQEVISGSIGKLQNTVDEFITDTVNIDNNAADLINRNKNDFYEKYSYLKPTCEKNFWEKAKGSLSKAWEWCKKHWKIVVTAVLVIAAIAILVFCPAAGLGLLALAAAKGVLLGAVIGGVIGGVFSGLIAWRTGKPIWEAVKEGAIDGAMWGAIFGVVSGFGSLAGQILGKSCTALAKFEPLINCAAKTLNGIDMALTGFDLASFGAIMYDPECGWAKFYDKLSSNKFFSALQFGAGLGGTFAYGMKSGIKFDRDHGLSKCFVAGTLVSTFAGFRAIETIKAGDIVLSADEKTGEISYQKVVETYVRETMKLVHLRVNGEEIITTEGHPFYVRELGFVKASELAAGDLLTDSSGNDMPVESVHTEITNIPVTVYNFQVEKTHTYFVTESCVLVHNGNYKETELTFEETQKLLTNLRNDSNGFFDNNRIYVDNITNNTPGPKKLTIFKKESSDATGIYRFKITPSTPNNADCFYFPFDGMINGSIDPRSHYSIPANMENRPIILTGGMMGCAVQVNKVKMKVSSRIEREKREFFEALDFQEKDRYFEDLDKEFSSPKTQWESEKNRRWEALKEHRWKIKLEEKKQVYLERVNGLSEEKNIEIEREKKEFFKDLDSQEKVKFFDGLEREKRFFNWESEKNRRWVEKKEDRWETVLEGKKQDYLERFNGLSEEQKNTEWDNYMKTTEDHLLFTHDTNSMYLKPSKNKWLYKNSNKNDEDWVEYCKKQQDKYISQLKSEGYRFSRKTGLNIIEGKYKYRKDNCICRIASDFPKLDNYNFPNFRVEDEYTLPYKNNVRNQEKIYTYEHNGKKSIEGRFYEFYPVFVKDGNNLHLNMYPILKRQDSLTKEPLNVETFLPDPGNELGMNDEGNRLGTLNDRALGLDGAGAEGIKRNYRIPD